MAITLDVFGLKVLNTNPQHQLVNSRLTALAGTIAARSHARSKVPVVVFESTQTVIPRR